MRGKRDARMGRRRVRRRDALPGVLQSSDRSSPLHCLPKPCVVPTHCSDLQLGTLGVNIVGSLAMGLLAGWFAFRGDGGQTLRLFLATGLLGGFTTFSAFSLDATLLWERGQTYGAVFYVVASVLTALLCVSVGLAIMRAALAS